MATVHKNSVKRKAILDALCASCEHPTAEMLYEQLKPMYPDLSLGTVYRNLSMFCNEGNAISIGNVAGKERFDGRLDEHSHFVCKNCSKVMDIDIPRAPGRVFSDIKLISGCKIESYSLIFTGLCGECSAESV